MSLVAAHPHLCKSFGWCLKPFSSSASHTFQTCPGNMLMLHLETFVKVKFVIWKGGVCEILHSSPGTRAGSDLHQYFHFYNNENNSEGIWEHSKFHALLGSLVISQIIVPPYLLEEFGRKKRDCWKLAFKSGFPWERWPCSEVCGITW